MSERNRIRRGTSGHGKGLTDGLRLHDPAGLAQSPEKKGALLALGREYHRRQQDFYAGLPGATLTLLVAAAFVILGLHFGVAGLAALGWLGAGAELNWLIYESRDVARLQAEVLALQHREAA